MDEDQVPYEDDDEKALAEQYVNRSTTLAIKGSTTQTVGLHIRDGIGKSRFRRFFSRLSRLWKFAKSWSYYNLIDWTKKAIFVSNVAWEYIEDPVLGQTDLVIATFTAARGAVAGDAVHSYPATGGSLWTTPGGTDTSKAFRYTNNLTTKSIIPHAITWITSDITARTLSCIIIDENRILRASLPLSVSIDNNTTDWLTYIQGDDARAVGYFPLVVLPPGWSMEFVINDLLGVGETHEYHLSYFKGDWVPI